jgi:hypothetical protein
MGCVARGRVASIEAPEVTSSTRGVVRRGRPPKYCGVAHMLHWPAPRWRALGVCTGAAMYAASFALVVIFAVEADEAWRNLDEPSRCCICRAALFTAVRFDAASWLLCAAVCVSLQAAARVLQLMRAGSCPSWWPLRPARRWLPLAWRWLLSWLRRSPLGLWCFPSRPLLEGYTRGRNPEGQRFRCACCPFLMSRVGSQRLRIAPASRHSQL